jgi:acyl-CoA thioesterase FadM
MGRVKLVLPKELSFQTEIKLRISDINYGGHLGNDAVLSLIHEARLQFLDSLGYTEKDVEGFGIIMTDSAIVYKTQGFYGDTAVIYVGTDEFNDYGCDIFYKLVNKETGKEIARAKTGIVLFDYDKQKVAKLPEQVATCLRPA